MTQALNHLKKIVVEVSRLSDSGKKSLVVFDLDSTLFDVSPRIQKILHDFSRLENFARLYPESCAILRTIEAKRNDWGFKDALIRSGLDHHSIEFHAALREFWKVNFFGNEYLQYDVPYDGAVEYVQAIAQAGAEISYLTGRDVARMELGTIKELQDWSFPLNDVTAKLELKPNKDLDDAQFKSDYFLTSKLKNYDKIFFFENEPVNIELIRLRHPEVQVVFFDSTHSGLSISPNDLPTIIHYLLD